MQHGWRVSFGKRNMHATSNEKKTTIHTVVESDLRKVIVLMRKHFVGAFIYSGEKIICQTSQMWDCRLKPITLLYFRRLVKLFYSQLNYAGPPTLWIELWLTPQIKLSMTPPPQSNYFFCTPNWISFCTPSQLNGFIAPPIELFLYPSQLIFFFQTNNKIVWVKILPPTSNANLQILELLLAPHNDINYMSSLPKCFTMLMIWW